MDKIKVGRDNFFAETPQIVKNIRDAVTYTSAGCVMFTDILAPLFGTTELNLTKYLALTALFAAGFARLFGIKDEAEKKS